MSVPSGVLTPVALAATTVRIASPRPDRHALLTAGLLAVQQRLRAAADHLGLTPADLEQARSRSTDGADLVGATAELIEQATAGAQRLGGIDRLWLLLTCVHGQYPLPDQVVRLRRDLELDDGLAASRYLIATLTDPLGHFPTLPAVLVTDRLMIDTGHTASGDLITGIQRVVRELLRRWIPTRPVLPVAWTEHQLCTRTLTAAELQRTARWGVPLDVPATDAAPCASAVGYPELVIPWRTTYLVPEVPLEPQRVLRLTALARYSGSRVVVIGYDLIPITNAASVGANLASAFAHYLSIVKHSAKIIAISETAAGEFRGLAEAFTAQGVGPVEIVTCSLPTEPPPHGAAITDSATGGVPVVLSVGSIEPRKNHLALLHAAEVLWREGLTFRLLLIGKATPASADVVQRIEELTVAGRDIELRSNVSDGELRAAYRSARLSVFVSTHEGYGLPVAESIASGTPVVTTDFGSTAEAALGGGALLVDPHDDDAIAAAIRSVLTDDDLQAALVRGCGAHPRRSWDDYADELWLHLHPATATSPGVTA